MGVWWQGADMAIPIYSLMKKPERFPFVCLLRG
jgi:hypothetical protein